MARTRIFVAVEAIQRNEREGTDFAPIVVRHDDGSTTYAKAVEIDGPSRVVYDRAGCPDGTRVWIETDAPITTT